jgi:hypothetical protein
MGLGLETPWLPSQALGRPGLTMSGLATSRDYTLWRHPQVMPPHLLLFGLLTPEALTPMPFSSMLASCGLHPLGKTPGILSPVFLQIGFDTPAALHTWPCILAHWGQSPCAYCSRGFAHKASSLSPPPPLRGFQNP